ncbi:hypothetical protein [Candidatus Sororendozoicomonas aggregata]|uniref:hypothetical protein n=1 Tax=Candidatus Sororendozoicomonas aggregata TaxID=3073239 RepID=UPI002ED66886
MDNNHKVSTKNASFTTKPLQEEQKNGAGKKVFFGRRNAQGKDEKSTLVSHDNPVSAPEQDKAIRSYHISPASAIKKRIQAGKAVLGQWYGNVAKVYSAAVKPEKPGNASASTKRKGIFSGLVKTFRSRKAKWIEGDKWKQQRYENTLQHLKEALKGGIPDKSALSKELRQLEKKRLAMLAEILNEKGGAHTPGKTPRSRYKHFLAYFRETEEHLRHCMKKNTDAASTEYLNGIFHELNTLSTHLFTTPLQPFYSAFIQSLKPARKGDVLTPDSGSALALRLEETQRLIQGTRSELENAATPFHSLRNQAGNIAAGELGFNYDPYYQGNTPYKLFELSTGKGEKGIACIRMGTPTIQAVGTLPELSPEFKRFIRAQGDNEHHLYINRQRRVGVEGQRSRLLEKTRDDKTLEKLSVVTIPADGNLYHQTGKYSEDVDFQTFSNTIVSHLLDDKEGFFFPSHLRRTFSGEENSFEHFIENTLQEVKKELNIPDGKKLTQDKRRAILFHFLNKNLVTGLIQATRATSYNNTCKDDIDRGGMANAYLYAVSHWPEARKSTEALETFTRELEGMTFAPAVLVKKRGVIEHRFHDFTNALRELDAIWR